MVNITELQKDFKSGMSIEDVLKKHKINLPVAMKLMNKRLTKQKKEYKSTGEEYISYQYEKYNITKEVNGKSKYFGGYDTLEDAIKVRDYLKVHGWNKHCLKTARRNCGVEE